MFSFGSDFLSLFVFTCLHYFKFGKVIYNLFPNPKQSAKLINLTDIYEPT